MRPRILTLFAFASILLVLLRTPALAQSGETWIETAAVAAKHNNPDSVSMALDHARKAFEQEGALKDWIAGCKQVAKVFRDQLGDPEQAMVIFRRCFPANNWKQPETYEEWDQAGWLYVNVAYTFNYSFEQYREAANYYERARQILVDRLQQDNLDVAIYLFEELGNLYTKLGDYRAAELLLERFKGIALREKEYDLAAQAYNDLAALHIAKKDPGKAVAICREGLDLKGLNPFSVGLLNGNLLKANTDLNRYPEALKNAEGTEKAFGAILAAGYQGIKGRLSIIEWLKGDIYVRTGNFAEAENAYRAARQYLLDLLPSGQSRDLARVYNSWAAMESLRGRHDDALALHQKALQSILPDFDPCELTDNPKAATFYAEKTIQETLLTKAQALQERFDAAGNLIDLESALQCHELVFEVEKLLRQTFPFESSQLEKAEESRRRSEEAMGIALKLWQRTGQQAYEERALAIAERSKSVLLLEAFHRSMANNLSSLPDSVMERERELQAAIAVAEKRLFDARSDGEPAAQIQELETRVLDRRQAYTAWVAQLDQDNRRYYDLKSGYRVATLADIRSNLHADDAFINYFTGEQHIYVFVVTADRFEWLAIDRDFPLNEWVTEFRNAIEGFQMPGADRSALSQVYSELGFKLYDKLFAPVAATGLPENLMIVPSGALGFLPFDALLTQPRNDARFRDYPYLVKDYNISYTWSATVQHMLAARPVKGAGRQFVGFAPAFTGKGGFGALANNREVVEDAFNAVGGRKYLNENANLGNWAQFAPTAGIIHLSTHAQANSSEGEFSFIVFANDQGGYDSLFVKDLYSMDLAAEMVVLSACETAIGKLYEGEGMISLARGFFFAGARSVITTLWQINDDANRRIMAGFYQGIKNGLPKSEAMRNAKLAQIQSDGDPLNAHPAYWAAFAPVGGMEPVFHPVAWLKLVGAGLLLGIAFLLIYRFRRKPPQMTRTPVKRAVHASS